MKKRVSGKSKANKDSKGIHINIHLTNRWLYTLIAVGILLIIAVGVYGSSSLLTPGVAPNPGHTINQLAPPSGCSAGQVLEWNGTANSNGGWSCSNGGSGSSVWQSTSSGTYISGNVSIGTTNSNGYNLLVTGGAVGSIGIEGSSGYVGEYIATESSGSNTGNSFCMSQSAFANGICLAAWNSVNAPSTCSTTLASPATFLCVDLDPTLILA